MNIKEKIEKWVKETLSTDKVVLVHPKEMKNGDYSFFNHSPGEANDFSRKLNENKIPEVEEAKTAGSFVNIYLSKQFFTDSVSEINKQKEKFGQNNLLEDQKIIIEHTQPNPFKEFHIGHLMNNAVGESIARTIKANKAEIKTCSYHGDVGLHVAKWAWATQKGIAYKEAYVYGDKAYKEDEIAKEEIIILNENIYKGKVSKVWKICSGGFNKFRNDFELICQRLGSKFNFQFWESVSGEKGRKIVENHIEDGIFEQSEGATVFRGEKHGLHTRVFLNSQDLPTYEAKELGLAEIKQGLFDYDQSITITANEQDSFFDVVEVATGEIFPELKGKLKHLSHGMLKLPTGKMSSRTGDIITAESLIEQVKEKVFEKIKDREFSDDEKEKIAEIVAIGAIKYSILRQAIGGDIIFDFDKSISFEGDSGPYLQYTAVRANSVLQKALNYTTPKKPRVPLDTWETTELERMLYRFPEVVERAAREYAPHHIVTYLTELASAFNNFYAKYRIIDDPSSAYKLALTQAVSHILQNGLYLLGVKVPERM